MRASCFETDSQMKLTALALIHCFVSRETYFFFYRAETFSYPVKIEISLVSFFENFSSQA